MELNNVINYSDWKRKMMSEGTFTDLSFQDFQNWKVLSSEKKIETESIIKPEPLREGEKYKEIFLGGKGEFETDLKNERGNVEPLVKPIKKKRVVIYCRTSSDDTNNSPDIMNQVRSCEDWIEEQENYDLIEKFIDEGKSGGSWNRKGLNGMLNQGKFHKFNIIVVWNRDRIARDLELYLRVLRLMGESGVRIYSVSENDWLSTDNFSDKVKENSLAQASEIFRLVTSEKVKKSYQDKKKRAEQRGEKLFWGRSRIKFDVDTLKKIQKMREEGWGYRRIEKQLKCYGNNVSYQTIRRLFENGVLQNPHTDLTSNSNRKYDNRKGVTE